MSQQDFDAFVNAVDEMMQAQKAYFAQRLPHLLEHSKGLERDVRKRISEIKAARKGRGQSTMFEG